jgi:hypothetical protein
MWRCVIWYSFQSRRVSQASRKQEASNKKLYLLGLFLDHEDGSSTFLRNVSKLLQDYCLNARILQTLEMLNHTSYCCKYWIFTCIIELKRERIALHIEAISWDESFWILFIVLAFSMVWALNKISVVKHDDYFISESALLLRECIWLF